MELRRFAAEIHHLRALIAVEGRDAEAEEEFFRSAGWTLLPYKEEQLNPKQITCIASCSRHRQLHRKLLPTLSCRKFLTSATAAQEGEMALAASGYRWFLMSFCSRERAEGMLGAPAGEICEDEREQRDERAEMR